MAEGNQQWFSTSTDLVKVPQVVWDVNGYYKSLGVPCDASRSEIRSAYQRCRGQESAWLTMVVKTLLGPERLDYDSVPLGQLYVDEVVLRFAQRVALDRQHSLGDEACGEETLDWPAWGWWSFRSRRRDFAELDGVRDHLVRKLSEIGVAGVKVALGWHSASPTPFMLVDLEKGVLGVFFHESGASPIDSTVADTVAEHIAAYAVN